MSESLDRPERPPLPPFRKGGSEDRDAARLQPAQTIYLDNNATTRPWPEVIETVADHLANSYGNPGSRHGEGRRARRVLEAARETIAATLGAEPSEVIFTSGGTEANNLAVIGFTQTAPGTVALTAGEHPSVWEACLALKQHGWNPHLLEVDREGRLSPDQYDRLPWDTLRLVTVILAHNETGVIQDIAPLAERCRRQGVPIHLDAVQAVGKVPVHFAELGVTSLSLGAHKFHGPRGIGALLLRTGAKLAPSSYGGHQEVGRRPGTEAVALAAGMAKALQLWHADQSTRTAQVRQMRDQLEQRLAELCSPVVINGSREHRLPNTLNISFPGLDGEAMLVALDLQGVACSLGSTCASGSAEPAPALVAMGCGPDLYRSAVRFSLSMRNTPEEIEEAARRIAAVVERLRRN